MQKTLQEIGFSEREAKVYLALLELGETTTGPVTGKTRLQSAKVYETLQKLIDKGLVSYVLKGKTKYFQAQDPKVLLKLVREKERRVAEILPKLKQKQAIYPQFARVHEGYKAIKSMFDMIIDGLDKNSTYYVFAFKDEYANSELASRFLRNIHMRLAENQVDDRLIADISVKKSIKNNYKDINMKIRYSKLHMPLGLMIIDDRVINWVWGDRPTAIEIQSEQIAGLYKQFFLDIWNLSKS